MRYLFFILFFCLFFVWTPLALAEYGNQSDVTGSIVTTSDQMPLSKGRFVRDRLRPRWLSRIKGFQIKVEQLTRGQVVEFPHSLQIDIANLIVGGKGYEASARRVANALVEISDQTSAQFALEVIDQLKGVAKSGRLRIAQIESAIKAYNSLIGTIPLQSLQNPSDELAAIQWILAPRIHQMLRSKKIARMKRTRPPKNDYAKSNKRPNQKVAQKEGDEGRG